jgi:hypothetical protein
MLQAMGSAIKAEVVDANLCSVNNNLGNSQALLQSIWLPQAQTLTGAAFVTTIAGNYTSNNFNGVALYTYSSGVLTRVAVSGNSDNTAFTSTGFHKVPFTSTYSASPGLYYVGLLFCEASQITAPGILSPATPYTSSALSLDLSGNAVSQMLVGNGVSSFPSSITISSYIVGTNQRYMALY